MNVKGTFYMKSGAIIEKEIIIDGDNPKKVIEDLRYRIKEGFRKNYDFQFTFGYTMFRGKDLSAVTLVEDSCES